MNPFTLAAKFAAPKRHPVEGQRYLWAADGRLAAGNPNAAVRLHAPGVAHGKYNRKGELLAPHDYTGYYQINNVFEHFKRRATLVAGVSLEGSFDDIVSPYIPTHDNPALVVKVWKIDLLEDLGGRATVVFDAKAARLAFSVKAERAVIYFYRPRDRAAAFGFSQATLYVEGGLGDCLLNPIHFSQEGC